MQFLKSYYKMILITVLIAIVFLAGYLYWQKYYNLDPNKSQTYYKIFNKNEILDGNEDKAEIVAQKLDKRLTKYHKTFIKMAGTSDEYKLKALFYMNFVHMYGVYGKRNLKENTLKDLLWGDENLHCGTTATFLAMLLDKTGYEFRTVSVGNGAHGFVEVKFENHWQILDPTINVWINKSTEELLSESERTNKQFFLKAADQFNQKAYEGIVRVINVQDMMLKLGPGYKPKIDKYDYIDLSQYQY